MIINKINNLESLSLTGEDIMRISGRKLRIIPYEALHNYKSLPDLFMDVEGLLILYQDTKNNGHWVCMQQLGPMSYEYFDPYGLSMDSDLMIETNNYTRMREGKQMPYLTALFEDILDGHQSFYTLVENGEQLQELDEDVNLCGRWCAIRLRLKSLSLQEFVNLFADPRAYTPDFWVSAISILL